MKNFKIYFLFIVLVLSFSCEHDEPDAVTACGVDNPAENLPWLKTMIESWEANSTIYKYMYVQQGTYLSQTIFMAGNCCPFCDSYFPIFNCDGEEIEGINLQDIKDFKTVWKPLDSECTL